MNSELRIFLLSLNKTIVDFIWINKLNSKPDKIKVVLYWITNWSGQNKLLAKILTLHGNSGKNAKLFSYMYPYSATWRKYTPSHLMNPPSSLWMIESRALLLFLSYGGLNTSGLWSGINKLKTNWKKPKQNH